MKYRIALPSTMLVVHAQQTWDAPLEWTNTAPIHPWDVICLVSFVKKWVVIGFFFLNIFNIKDKSKQRKNNKYINLARKRIGENLP